jgi:hypothetical protein
MRLGAAFVGGLTTALASFVLAAPAQGASGVFDRTWGEDVDSIAPGIGFEICTVAANCKTGVTTAPALGGEMAGPQGVATDAAGNVYVADTLHNRVQKFADPLIPPVVPPPAGGGGSTPTSQATGLRAAALKKCKKKRGKKRKNCIKRAKKLPL